MASLGNKKTWRIVGIIIAVGLIITAAVVIADLTRDPSVDNPEALEITLTVDGEEIAVRPYRVCDLFEDDACRTFEENTATIDLGPEETTEVKVPDEVASVTWTLQRFYADDAVNTADTKQPGDSSGETVAGSASVSGERTPLGVIEVSTAVIGTNAAGEETMYGITWSIMNEAAGMDAAASADDADIEIDEADAANATQGDGAPEDGEPSTALDDEPATRTERQ